MCKFCNQAKLHKMFNYCPYCGTKIRDFIPSLYPTFTNNVNISEAHKVRYVDKEDFDK